MSLWKIAWRSIQQRALASTLTTMSMALSVTLVVAVVVIAALVEDSFSRSANTGYNLLVGAKGGRTDLVLNSLYFLSRPVENVPWWFYEEFLPAEKRGDGKNGRWAPLVTRAIPCCLGDYYKEFRVVGTLPDMFEEFEGRKFEFSDGANFEQDDYFGGVIGAEVAKATGLQVGDDFEPTHGIGGHTHSGVAVRGILARTGTPIDRALFMNIEGFYQLGEGEHQLPSRLQKKPDSLDPPPKGDKSAGSENGKSVFSLAAHHPGHDHLHEDDDIKKDGAAKPDKAKPDDAAKAEPPRKRDKKKQIGGPVPKEEREVTAILVAVNDENAGLDALYLQKEIDKGNFAMAVYPNREIATLFQTFVRPMQMVLLIMTVLIMIVASIGILVSIYNSMSERRHEIAVMRALGAGRNTVMMIVLLESILLSLAGGVIGWVLGHGLIAAVGPWMYEQAGVRLGLLQFVPLYELILIPALILLASLVGFLPAMTAYRTDVSRALSATP